MSTTTNKPRLSLRWFQFRLRTLLVAMLVLGCGLGWWAQKYRAAREAWGRIDALKVSEYGEEGIYYADDSKSSGNWLERTLLIDMPHELIDVSITSRGNDSHLLHCLSQHPSIKNLGLWHFSNITEEDFTDSLSKLQNLEWLTLDSYRFNAKGWDKLRLPHLKELKLFANSDMPEEILASLAHFQSLEELDCSHYGSVSEQTMQAIGSLKNLRVLRIDIYETQDSNWKHLGGLTSLVELDLYDSISDEGVLHLPPLPNLEKLTLRGAGITGSGFAQLAHMPKLKRIDLVGSHMTNEGLQQLASVKTLEEFHLSSSEHVTNHGIKHLIALPTLRVLNLSWNHKLSNETVDHLLLMPQLQRVDLTGTSINDVTAKRLKKLRPYVTIKGP